MSAAEVSNLYVWISFHEISHKLHSNEASRKSNGVMVEVCILAKDKPPVKIP